MEKEKKEKKGKKRTRRLNVKLKQCKIGNRPSGYRVRTQELRASRSGSGVIDFVLNLCQTNLYQLDVILNRLRILVNGAECVVDTIQLVLVALVVHLLTGF